MAVVWIAKRDFDAVRSLMPDYVDQIRCWQWRVEPRLKVVMPGRTTWLAEDESDKTGHWTLGKKPSPTLARLRDQFAMEKDSRFDNILAELVEQFRRDGIKCSPLDSGNAEFTARDWLGLKLNLVDAIDQICSISPPQRTFVDPVVRREQILALWPDADSSIPEPTGEISTELLGSNTPLPEVAAPLLGKPLAAYEAIQRLWPNGIPPGLGWEIRDAQIVKEVARSGGPANVSDGSIKKALRYIRAK